MRLRLAIFEVDNKRRRNTNLSTEIYKTIIVGKNKIQNPDNIFFYDTNTIISDKNEFYNELTAQYWMWKNYDSDYYGMCHYRRFISFSNKHYNISTGEHNLGLVSVPLLSKNIVDEHNLNNIELIEKEISNYDLICMEPISVKKYFPEKNMYNTYKNMPLWHNSKDIDSALDIIKELYPEIYKSALYYFFKSKDCYYYNCWIMSKELLNKFSKFQFDILFALEKHIDYTHYSKQKSRALGLIGERLFGVYLTYIKKQKSYRIKHRQILFVENPIEEIKPKPFKFDKNIPIVSICNNYYVPYFSALLKSLTKFGNNINNYDFILIAKDISDENKKILLQMIKDYKNISLRFYNPIKEINDIRFYNNSNTVAENTYYRLFTPWILENYDKAIVIDSDLIFNKDPAKLFEIDVENFYIGAAKDAVFMSWVNGMDISFKDYSKNYMKLKDPYNYVNTGVLLMNLKKIRNDFTQEKFINLNTNKPYKIREQDSMNVIFQEKVKFIPINWNFYIAVNDFLKKCMPNAPKSIYEEYIEAEKNPFILHWASYPKPWSDPTIIDANIWWEFSRQTPYYEICLNRLLNKKNNYKHSSIIKRIAEKFAPPFTRRRAFLKKLIWKNTSKRTILGKIYYKIIK